MLSSCATLLERHVPGPLGGNERAIPHSHALTSPAQREHGLPPDGERALRLNETQLVVTVPEGCTPGDSFDVRMEFGARAPRSCGMLRVGGGGTGRFI